MAMPPTKDEDRPNRLPWPPILFAATLIAAWLLQTFAGVLSITLAPVVVDLGWLLLLAGLGIGFAGFRGLRTAGTTFDPTGPATHLARGGIYEWSRNPMYLGATAAFLGLSLALSSAWLLVLSLVLPFLLAWLAIKPEEAYLGRRFGADYAAYCAKVRRWL